MKLIDKLKQKFKNWKYRKGFLKWPPGTFFGHKLNNYYVLKMTESDKKICDASKWMWDIPNCERCTHMNPYWMESDEGEKNRPEFMELWNELWIGNKERSESPWIQSRSAFLNDFYGCNVHHMIFPKTHQCPQWERPEYL